MSQWVSFTNHKLYQSRLVMEQMALADHPVLIESLEEAALLHLSIAYRSYLNELGSMVQLTGLVKDLPDLLQRAHLVTGEMRELEQLNADSFSWLGQFSVAVRQLEQPVPGKGRNAATASPLAAAASGLIIASSEGERVSVAVWHDQLSQLIDRQRDNRHES